MTPVPTTAQGTPSTSTASSTPAGPGPEVRTTGGTVRGAVTRDGLHAFRGIPYAAPPVGNLRFRAPRPAAPWTGTRTCVHEGPVAPQRPSHSPWRVGAGVEQSEDCLTLTVLTPTGTVAQAASTGARADAPAAGLRPVVVWIHGGGFVAGAGSVPGLAPEGLVTRGDVVVVTVNYRLGALGFLDFSRFSSPRRTFDTNVGLRDIVAALEWVRDNVAGFGGDPDNVTLLGHSAGATAVTTLLCIPSAAGLFHRAIAQSPAVASVIDSDRAAGWASDFITWLHTTESLAVDALLAAPPRELVDAGTRLSALASREAPGARCMSPVVDGDFLPEHPADVFAAGRAHPVPLLIGSTKHEGLGFVGRRGEEVPTSAGAIDLMFEITDPGAQLRVLSAYPGYPSARARAQLGGDALFWIPAVRAAQSHSAHAPTFVYRYDFTTPALNLRHLGGAHGTDLLPVLVDPASAETRSATWLGGADELAALSERMRDHWLALARDGRPGAGWPAYDSDDRPTMIFDARDRVISDPGRERRRAWEGAATYR